MLRIAAAIMLTSASTVMRVDHEPASAPLLGGAATVFTREPNAFSLPAPGLTVQERRAFAVGNSFFRDNWVAAPASAAGRDGLGPMYNAQSCSACHINDGRGRPPLAPDDLATGMVIRISPRDADGRPHPIYGDQLQDQATLKAIPEARITLTPRLTPGHYADGDAYELLEWTINLSNPGYGPIGDALLSPRVGQQLIGVGLLEAVDEQAILAPADPDDRDGDGVSGRPHMVAAADSNQPAVGRFGWKASKADLASQITAALREDIGITSLAFPAEAFGESQHVNAPSMSNGEPEIDDLKLDRLVHYCRVLAVPAQRDADLPEVLRGQALFSAMGCTACHTPELKTGHASPIEQFRDITIHPYTDLLLHDMGEGLADNRRDGDATGREWRTPPLWGIGLIEVVNGHTRFLHDGRARSLEEAVLWHGGEAAAASEAFKKAPREDRAALLAFLGSL